MIFIREIILPILLTYDPYVNNRICNIIYSEQHKDSSTGPCFVDLSRELFHSYVVILMHAVLAIFHVFILQFIQQKGRW